MFTVKSTAVITYVQSYEVVSERFHLIQNIKTNYIRQRENCHKQTKIIFDKKRKNI